MSPSLFYQAKEEREHWREVCDSMANLHPHPNDKEEES